MDQLTIIITTLITIFFWQHIGRQLNLPRPSDMLNIMANTVRAIGIVSGSIFASISSVLTSEFLTTIKDLTVPVFIILIFPFHVFVGYFQSSKLFYRPVLIYMGSLMFMSAIFYGGIWYNDMKINNIKGLIYDHRRGLCFTVSMIIAIATTANVYSKPEIEEQNSKKRRLVD